MIRFLRNLFWLCVRHRHDWRTTEYGAVECHRCGRLYYWWRDLQ